LNNIKQGEIDMSKQQETDNVFPKKWEKHLPTGFQADAEALDEAALKKMIIECENNANVVEREKDADEKLTAAKELVKDLASGYRDAIKSQQAKIQMCLFLLEQRGAL
jgi:hypothetical protein